MALQPGAASRDSPVSDNVEYRTAGDVFTALGIKSMATWFEQLTGFAEVSHREVHKNISHRDDVLVSRPNGRSMVCGRLETPSLRELRKRAQEQSARQAESTVTEVVADVRELHRDKSIAGSLFQVASQFNLLEMASPAATPEMGVGIYQNDPTQGPACATAAGAGTIYRNYFAVVNGRVGQTANNQIDCLADLGAALGNDGDRLWRMRNGYALATESGLAEISNRLETCNELQVQQLRDRLRIGIQWNTEVTLAGGGHTVSQAYCSALPVAYSHVAPYFWERFARLVLEALYEATVCAGVLNAQASGVPIVYLTAVGGGAFGNPADWIFAAIERALHLYRNAALDVRIVSFRAPNPAVRRLISGY